MASPSSDASTKNFFYRDYFQQIIFFVMIAVFSVIFIVAFIMFQILHRPNPIFSTVSANGSTMPLTAYLEPNLRANVILRWASKAATLAYNFGFSNYQEKVLAVKPYFTTTGWSAYQGGIQSVIDRVRANQLIVQGVASGTPVISNQGELPGKGYSWRVQIPFLVTYLSSDQSQNNSYFVLMTIVKVPTYLQPEGIGIDTFEMR